MAKEVQTEEVATQEAPPPVVNDGSSWKGPSVEDSSKRFSVAATLNMLHDPYNNTYLYEGAAVSVPGSSWLQSQLEAGLIRLIP